MRTSVGRVRATPVPFMLLFLLSMSTSAHAASLVALADPGLHILRGASVFNATAGVPLQAGDILESADGAAQFELDGASLIAIAPHSRAMLDRFAGSSTALEITLLSGWLKLQTGVNQAAQIDLPGLRVTLPTGATIVHAGSDGAEMFAETGTQIVYPLDIKGRPGGALKIEREQYAQHPLTAAVKILARATAEFLREMPQSFRDPLMPLTARLRIASAPLTSPHEADYAAVAGWLNAPLPARRSLVTRFAPRLKDPEFRRHVEADLGSTPEWKALLHPPIRRSEKSAASSGVY